jgi:branched-chain amino acid transport system permease protein
MEAFGGLFFAPQTVLNLIPNLRLMLFGALIIFFLIVEPEGLNRLWRNIRNYFRSGHSRMRYARKEQFMRQI